MSDESAVWEDSFWNRLPDDVLFKIFQFLPAATLVKSSEVCRRWYRVTNDDLLWKDLFQQHWKIDRAISLSPCATSWLSEYQRLGFHIPQVESEVLHEHTDEVHHVSFSHNGEMFVTCSKDGYVKVWSSAYPCQVIHTEDTKEYDWTYTQYSQFNEQDTLILVAGILNNCGEEDLPGQIALFRVQHRTESIATSKEFTKLYSIELYCRLPNVPYDMYGAWFSNNYMLSGSFKALGNNKFTSTLLINREELYKFRCVNGWIRQILIAHCAQMQTWEQASEAAANESTTDELCRIQRLKVLDPDIKIFDSESERGQPGPPANDSDKWTTDTDDDDDDDGGDDDDQWPELSINRSSLSCEFSTCSKYQNNPFLIEFDDDDHEELFDKYIIFTTSSKTGYPHQIGIKRLRTKEAQDVITKLKSRKGINPISEMSLRLEEYSEIDHIFEFHGFIIGLCLSPDNRYLYVNCRAWKQGFDATVHDVWKAPPISEEIDIHIIDLETMTKVKSSLRGHKAFTPQEHYFIIYLDVTDEYVASGAEDKNGYVWDRHYGILLHKYLHDNVVNAVAFNPRDTEMLVTVSDDHTIRVWRSKSRESQVKTPTTAVGNHQIA